MALRIMQKNKIAMESLTPSPFSRLFKVFALFQALALTILIAISLFVPNCSSAIFGWFLGALYLALILFLFSSFGTNLAGGPLVARVVLALLKLPLLAILLYLSFRFGERIGLGFFLLSFLSFLPTILLAKSYGDSRR